MDILGREAHVGRSRPHSHMSHEFMYVCLYNTFDRLIDVEDAQDSSMKSRLFGTVKAAYMNVKRSIPFLMLYM